MIDIYSKKFLMKQKETTPTPEPEPEPSLVQVLGAVPKDFSNGFKYNLIKRNDYFYMLYEDSPKNGEDDTEVQKLNFISRTKDFKSWEGSGIGSGYIRYDETADAFFCSHLGMRYKTNLYNDVKYNIIKINPDDFSYKVQNILTSTMEITSRGITHIERVGNYLMLLCYINKTSVYSFYSSNNGETWSSKLLVTTPSFGIGLDGIKSCSNGNGMKASIYYGSTTSSSKFFTSPMACQNSSSKATNTDRAGYSKGNKLIGISTNNELTISTDGVNDTKYQLSGKLATENGVFYGDYYITAAPTSGGNSTKFEYLGKIILHNLKTREIFLFDPELDAVSASFGYYTSQLKILNIFDDYLYFSFAKNGSNCSVGKVAITDILNNLQKYTA